MDIIESKIILLKLDFKCAFLSQPAFTKHSNYYRSFEVHTRFCDLTNSKEIFGQE
jgi:hypothetical protein